VFYSVLPAKDWDSKLKQVLTIASRILLNSRFIVTSYGSYKLSSYD
jgi:hypothetical protein